MNENLFIDVLNLSLQLEEASAALDPFKPATLDRVRSIISKLETVINDASASLNQVSAVLTATQGLLGLYEGV